MTARPSSTPSKTPTPSATIGSTAIASAPQRADDRLVYEEADETFSCRISRTKSDRYLLIGSRQTLSTEYRFLDADKPDGEFQVIQPRRPRLEYSADHLDGHFYIRTNRDAKNFKLVRAPIQSPGLDHWEEVVPHRADVFLERFELFRDFLVVEERRDGLIRLHIRPWSGAGRAPGRFRRAGLPGPTSAPTTNWTRTSSASFTPR